MEDFQQFERIDFTTDYLGGGARYRLPRRKFRRARHLGWVVVGGGLILTLFMLGWMSGPVLGGIKDWSRDQGVALFSIAFACFGLIGLVPGIGALLGGLAIVMNRSRCDIQVRDGKIKVKDRFFLARLRRKREIHGIVSLRLMSADKAQIDDEHEAPPIDVSTWLGDFDMALIAKTQGKDFPIAIAYPRETLVRLAEELAPRLEAQLDIESTATQTYADNRADSLPVRSKIVIEEDDYESEPIVIEQPVDSTATIERRDYGITIEIPPAGIWKGSKGLMVFAVLWNSFISLFLVIGVLATIGVIEMEDGSPPWVMLLFMIPFVAVGVGITLAAINMGRRHATIATADDLVMVVRHTIFGKTTKEWSAADIDSIRCGNSGMEVNDVPVKELQIIPVKENKFGCLSQLDEAELKWIASELNQALGVTASRSRDKLERALVERDESGFALPAANSHITIERQIDGLRVNVPPQGLLRNIPMILFGLIFAAIGCGIAIAVGWPELKKGFDGMQIGEALIGLVFLLVFGGAGLGIMCAGLVAGRRRFLLTIEHNELTLLRRGPFFRKTFRWHRDDLVSVEVTTSGVEANNRKLSHVYIRSRKADSMGIMTGHETSDLVLVATVISESLDLTEDSPAA